jgi:hypothetical protein
MGDDNSRLVKVPRRLRPDLADALDRLEDAIFAHGLPLSRGGRTPQSTARKALISVIEGLMTQAVFEGKKTMTHADKVLFPREVAHGLLYENENDGKMGEGGGTQVPGSV